MPGRRQHDLIPVAPSGSAFPAAPATGSRFIRSDRNYTEYFWDGARWLSTQRFTLATSTPNAATVAATVTTQADIGNPEAGQWSIFIEQIIFTSRQTVGTTDANYFTCQLRDTEGAANLGVGVSAQNNALGAYVAKPEVLNIVRPATAHNFRFNFNLTGTATAILNGAMIYRLIG